ncbi:MAG: hypothetical protein ACLFP2_04755 [Candidatus Woesearchaeota archaeon]
MTDPITDKYRINAKLESIDYGTIFDKDITEYLEQGYGVLFGRERDHELPVPAEFNFVSRNQGLIDIRENGNGAELIYYEASDKAHCFFQAMTQDTPAKETYTTSRGLKERTQHI